MHLAATGLVHAQYIAPDDQLRKAIADIIEQYSQAREKGDTLLLKTLLTSAVDQLVSTGVWRNGIGAAVEGMVQSSTASPGIRTLHIEKMRLFNPNSAIVDCRYEIQSKDGNSRKMWSSFIVVADKGIWKITAIRNMLPASQ